jgi:hypothetical protein
LPLSWGSLPLRSEDVEKAALATPALSRGIDSTMPYIGTRY